ncbi:hypothetical protein ACFUC1_02570 [Pedococcus sp. NPDC057267]|uniref:hypothetical protein n=1 Tax=Pedococcus sp. NPDC057267 TaxID=3346077 RepID=UPI003642662F
MVALVAGYRKTWHLLRREGQQVLRCTGERLVRQAWLRGTVRRRTWKIMVPDPSAARRPRDMAARQLAAPR